jgi:hypothetical protein
LTGGDAKIEADLLPDRLTLRVTGHHDHVKDQILFVSEGPFAVRRQNVGHTRTLGGDVELTYRMPAMVVTVGYAYADSIITDFPRDPSREGKRVPNVSRHQGVMTVTMGDPSRGLVTLMGRYLSRQYADDLNAQPVGRLHRAGRVGPKAGGSTGGFTWMPKTLTDRPYIATQTGLIKTLGAPPLVLAGVRARLLN